jgi:hypothetical protein
MSGIQENWKTQHINLLVNKKPLSKTRLEEWKWHYVRRKGFLLPSLRADFDTY